MKTNKCLFQISAVLLILVPFLTITPNARGSDREDWKGKIYWVHYGREKIAQANHDGSNRTFFADTGSNPVGVSVDVKNGFMYWSNLGVNNRPYTKALDGSIQRCQMDNCPGTTITIVDKGKTASPFQLTIDGVNRYIYWTDGGRDMVLRSKYDGSNVETVLIFKNKSMVFPIGCYIDEENGILYWSERNSDRIGRNKLSDIKMPYTPQESDYIVTEGLNGAGHI